MPQQEAEWVDRSSLPQQVRYRNAQGWRLVHTVEPGGERSALLVVWEKPVPPVVGVSARALTWLASSPDPVVAGEATALIAHALGVVEEPKSPKTPPSRLPQVSVPGASMCGAAHEHRV